MRIYRFENPKFSWKITKVHIYKSLTPSSYKCYMWLFWVFEFQFIYTLKKIVKVR